MMKEQLGMKIPKAGCRMEIIDNFLTETQFSTLQEIMLQDWFPWYFCEGIVKNPENEYELHDYQFTHTFIRNKKVNSDWLVHLEPILAKIQPKEVLRIKANFQPVTKEKQQSKFHIDYEDKNIIATTAIFYLNTNNGYTIFKDGTKVESIANRLLTFDKNTSHAGVSCTDKPFRCLINFNYKKGA